VGSTHRYMLSSVANRCSTAASAGLAERALACTLPMSATSGAVPRRVPVTLQGDARGQPGGGRARAHTNRHYAATRRRACLGPARKPVGRPQAALEGLPDALLAGELARCRLVLSNVGPAPLRGLRCTAAGPDLHLAPAADGERSPPAGAGARSGSALAPAAVRHRDFHGAALILAESISRRITS